MVLGEILHDKPKTASDRHQYDSDLSKAAFRTVEFREEPCGTTIAPPHSNRGDCVGLGGTNVHPPTHLRSSCTHSPRAQGRKSGAKRGEWKGSSVPISVLPGAPSPLLHWISPSARA